MIKLKNFVDVNLTSVNPSSSEENKTVVYIYGDTEARISRVLNASTYKSTDNAVNYSVFDQEAKDFADQFFALGGASLRIIKVQTTSATSLAIVKTNNESVFIPEIRNLPMEQVAIVVREATAGATSPYDSKGYHFEEFTPEGATSATNGFAVLLSNIQALSDDYGTAFRKLLVRGTKNVLAYPYTTEGIKALTRDINLVWKLNVDDEKDLAGPLAYLSKVTLTEPDTLRDYSFTEEAVCVNQIVGFNAVDWEAVKTFINVTVNLENRDSAKGSINIGGNTSAGYDLIQEFESIYISQRLVNRELALLKSKIDLSNAYSIIHSTIIDVMETYFNIGYLVQTQYTGANIYRNIGGRNVCVLAQGEVLTGGYKINILPKVAGTDIHSFPEVEIIINTNKGIRFIKTTGLVL